MIKPEIDLELSINALRVYGIEPNIIKSMLSNLQKVVNKNCNKPAVMPSLPDGLDDDSNCDHNFKLGWIACWKALTGNGA
jgi:hypothetical protein